MKKTLIAMAALAATGAFAQNMTIIGNIDVGYKSTNTQVSAAAGSVSKGEIAQSNVGTNQLDFIGSEDLGGGMKAGLFFELDINAVQSSTQDGGTAANGQLFTGTPFTGQQYLSLEGGFGAVKLGTPNAGMLSAQSLTQPFGTALGSGYSAGFARMGSLGGTGTNQYLGGPSSGNRVIRHEKSIGYDTPNFSGFSANIQYAFQNDTSTTATSNTEGFYNVTLNYSNGPLNLVYSTATSKVGANNTATSFTALGSVASSTANSDVTHSVLGGNYTFGPATVYAGYTKSSSNGFAVNEDATSWNVAGKYAVTPAVDLTANYLVRNTNATNANPAKMFGLGADYKLSKRTGLYARYEMVDTNTNDSDLGQTTTYAVGVRTVF